jgi:hypothetical protein
MTETYEHSGISAEEYRKLISEVGFHDANDIGEFFDVDSRLARYWADGSTNVPVPVVMTLELMRHFSIPIDKVNEIIWKHYTE